jgi:Ribbon-helix-helix protein, copG family
MSDPPRRSVREPIQVYLDPADRELLDAIAARSGLSRAEVLRRGIRRVGAEVLGGGDAALTFLDEMVAGGWPADMPDDVGERHDDYLTHE